jgi:hypothetical protein
MRKIFIKLPNKFIEKTQAVDFNGFFINNAPALINIFHALRREK